MDFWGYVLLIAAAVLIGLVADLVLADHFGYGALITVAAAGVAGYVFSEYSLLGIGHWGQEYLGVAVFPALIAAVVAAIVAETVIFYSGRALAR